MARRGKLSPGPNEFIHHSTIFITYENIKPFMKYLGLVYKTDIEEIAQSALDDLDEK